MTPGLALGIGSLALAAALLLLAFGLPGGLFGIGLLAFGWRWAAECLEPGPGLPGFLAEVPWWAVLAFAGAASLPLVARIAARLAPFRGEPSRKPASLRVAAALVLVSLLVPVLPSRLLLASAGSLLVLGLGWVIAQGLPRLGIAERLAEWSTSSRTAFLALLLAIGLTIAWPFRTQAAEPGLVDLWGFASELGRISPFVIAAGLVLLLIGRGGGMFLSPHVLTAGRFLYAVFLINSSATWLFLPVPFLIGLLLASIWLFRPRSETDRLREALATDRPDLRQLIQNTIDSTELGSRFLTIQKELTGKFEKAELSPEEYDQQLSAYRDYLEKRGGLQTPASGISRRMLAFGIGEASIRANIESALKVGALLALGPLLITLYQYLPSRGVRHPHPVADLLAFLIGASTSWMLLAFFFGYFYVHLRGDTGLTKGLHLFVMVATPFAVYRLLGTPTLEQMRPFLLWAAQLFLFCTLLGLLAFDYGLLRKNGFRFKDLRLIHDLPVLSAYASTVVAAVVPAVAAILTGEVKDLVSFFLENILPRVPS